MATTKRIQDLRADWTRRVRETARELETELGRPPLVQEVAEALNVRGCDVRRELRDLGLPDDPRRPVYRTPREEREWAEWGGW